MFLLAMPLSFAATGFATAAGLLIAIGAQNAFVLRQGLQRQHVGLVVGTCALSDIALMLGGVFGIGRLMQAWPAALQLLRYGGAIFLAAYGVVAAWRAWRGAGELSPGTSGETSRTQVLLTCLAFTFLNPHVYLDTLVLIGSLANRHPDPGRWFYAAGACTASVAWFAALGYGARLLLPLFRSPAAWRVLDGLIAAIMFGLCLTLLLHAPV
ncbi:Transporter, LysE family [plant metagenome]